MRSDGWHRPEPLAGRQNDVHRAVARVLDTGVVAVVGPRDVGTSAVAAAVVQELIDSHGGDPERTHRWDLRGRPELPAVPEPESAILFLDNAITSEQVRWLASVWPSRGPRLVIAGVSEVGDAAEHSVQTVDELGIKQLREIWDAELDGPEPTLRERLQRKIRRHPDTDPVDELLRACFGSPRAVRAFAREIRRGTATVADLLAGIHGGGRVTGPVERVWTTILDNLTDGLTDDARWLLHVLAVPPITSLTPGTAYALIGDSGPLEELRTRGLVEKTVVTYRLPREIRRMIEGTTTEADRRAVALRAAPILLRYFAEHTDRLTEPTARSLFDVNAYADDRLRDAVIHDLARIAAALETRYVRTEQPQHLLTVNDALHTLAERARRPELAGAAAIRMATAHRLAGRFGPAGELLDVADGHTSLLRRSAAVELVAREHIERARLAMIRSDSEGVARAEGLLEWMVTKRWPRRRVDVPAALVTLGETRLHRGRSAEALEYLRRAEHLASGRLGARSVELQGDAIAQETLAGAAPLWQTAGDLYRKIGDELGEARTLQRLGSAALADPAVAGLLGDGQQDAARVALTLLERANSLRPGQPGTRLFEDLRTARARVG